MNIFSGYHFINNKKQEILKPIPQNKIIERGVIFMNDVRCPHCGNHVTNSDYNYYACEDCSTMFHTVEENGKVKAEVEYY